MKLLVSFLFIFILSTNDKTVPPDNLVNYKSKAVIVDSLVSLDSLKIKNSERFQKILGDIQLLAPESKNRASIKTRFVGSQKEYAIIIGIELAHLPIGKMDFQAIKLEAADSTALYFAQGWIYVFRKALKASALIEIGRQADGIVIIRYWLYDLNGQMTNLKNNIENNWILSSYGLETIIKNDFMRLLRIMKEQADRQR